MKFKNARIGAIDDIHGLLEMLVEGHHQRSLCWWIGYGNGGALGSGPHW